MNKAISIFFCTIALFATVRAQEGLLYEIPLKLPAEVNSDAEEAAVLVSHDGGTLYFSRIMYKGNTGGVKGGQDIWSSTSDGSESWYLAEHNLLELNNKGNNAVIGVSLDGNTLYLLNKYKGNKTTMGVSKSRRDGGQWSEPEALNIPGLIMNSSFYGFNMDPTGTFLIISMNSVASLGQEDLYVSKNEGGTWSSPIHLGNVINSAGYEITPFLTADTKSLYFSTNARGGFGNADIYKSDRLDDTWTNWSEPVNMGDNINSAGFDAFFSISTSNQIFLCSNRSGMLSDIFQSEVLERLVIGEKIEGQELVGTVVTEAQEPDEEASTEPESTEVTSEEKVVSTDPVAPDGNREESTEMSEETAEAVVEETTEPSSEPEVTNEEEAVSTDPVAPDSNREESTEMSEETAEAVVEETTEPSSEPVATNEEEAVSTDPVAPDSNREESTEMSEETAEAVVEETTEPSSEPEVTNEEEAVSTDPVAPDGNREESTEMSEETTEPSSEPEATNEEEAVSTDPVAPDGNREESTEMSEETEVDIVEETTEESIPELMIAEEEAPTEEITTEEAEPVIEETTEDPSIEVASEEEAPILEVPSLETEPVVEETVVEPVVNDDPVVSDVSARREVADAGQVYFDLNSSYFSEAEAEKLLSIYEKLGSQPSLNLEVLGYSDNIGEEFYNMWISARRADRVVQYLVEKGIDASRLSSKWFGEANQAASCVECSEEQHQKNRRVELIIQ